MLFNPQSGRFQKITNQRVCRGMVCSLPRPRIPVRYAFPVLGFRSSAVNSKHRGRGWAARAGFKAAAANRGVARKRIAEGVRDTNETQRTRRQSQSALAATVRVLRYSSTRPEFLKRKCRNGLVGRWFPVDRR